jgi:hypothetical protein
VRVPKSIPVARFGEFPADSPEGRIYVAVMASTPAVPAVDVETIKHTGKVSALSYPVLQNAVTETVPRIIQIGAERYKNLQTIYGNRRLSDDGRAADATENRQALLSETAPLFEALGAAATMALQAFVRRGADDTQPQSNLEAARLAVRIELARQMSREGFVSEYGRAIRSGDRPTIAAYTVLASEWPSWSKPYQAPGQENMELAQLVDTARDIVMSESDFAREYMETELIPGYRSDMQSLATEVVGGGNLLPDVTGDNPSQISAGRSGGFVPAGADVLFPWFARIRAKSPTLNAAAGIE